MKRFVLVAAMVLVLLPVSASKVTPEMAVAVVADWGKDNARVFGTNGKVLSVRPEHAVDGTLLWYEVATADGRCVVTSPDTRIEPVIAVVDDYEGDIPVAHPLRTLLAADLRKRLAVLNAAEPSAPRASLTSVAVQSSAACTSLRNSAERAARKWGRATGTDGSGARLLSSTGFSGGHPPFVAKFIYEWGQKKLTHWNQTSRNGELCYNYYTPHGYPCGCVATAGAALLQYYGITTAPKNVTRTCSVDGVTFTLTTKGVDYDWSILPGSISSSTPLTDAQRELLGRVAYDVGVCLEMEYGPSGSAASSYDLAYVLRNDFGFADARYVYSITAAHYEKLIYSQLRCGAPVVLSISGVNEQNEWVGHSVLGVGYGEDAAGVPYTRVFMGWGGMSDAWYALPDVEEYTVLDSVVTMIGTSTSTMSVYGRVTTDEGFGAAQERLTAAYYSLTTGAFGHWGTRVSPNISSRTVTYGKQSCTFTVGSAATSSAVSYNAASLAEALPGAVDFTGVSAESALRMYSSPTEAQEVALRDGKLLFVLSGADWCGFCSIVKNYLKSLGTGFTDHYVLYYCNIDCDNAGMANGSPSYGVFDPRVFKLENRWNATNGRLAYESGGVEEKVQGVLDEAWSAWTAENRAVAAVRIDGADVVGEPTSFTMTVTHADGVTRELRDGLVFARTSGSAAAFSGMTLQPVNGASGNVTFTASRFYWGAERTAAKTVEVVLPLEIHPVTLATGKSGEAYSQTFSVQGGKGPYSWAVFREMDYSESRRDSEWIESGDAKGWQYDDRCWELELPFEFKFYNKGYRKAFVNSNGTITFDSSFSGYSESVSTLKSKTMIAALWTDLTTGTGDIFVDSSSNAVTIRWQGSYWSGGEVNFAVTLTKDGQIEIRYGRGNTRGGVIGISAGDGEHCLVSPFSQYGSMNNAGTLVFTTFSLPSGLEFQPDGRIVGTPEQSGIYNMKVRATDSNGMSKSMEYELEVLAKIEFRVGDHVTRTGGGALVQYVHDGEAAVAPTLEMDNGWRFYGWDREFSAVSGCLVVTAICSDMPMSFVDFDLGDHGVGVLDGVLHLAVTNGQAATAPVLVAETGYRHVGWSADIGSVQSNMTVHAVYQPLKLGEVFEAEWGGYTWSVTNVSTGVAGILGAMPKLAGTVVIPSYLQGVLIKEIEESAFRGNDTLVEVTIPDSVTTVGRYAFAQCSALQKARVLGGSIGFYAFYSCAHLGEAFVGTGVSWLAYRSVSSCPALSNVVFAAQTTGVTLQAPFYGDTALRQLHLPAKVSLSQGNPFAYCEALTNATIDAGGEYRIVDNVILSTDGTRMFGALAGVKVLQVPDTVTTITYRATEGCSLLEELILPDSVTSLTSQSIYCCDNLKTIKFGSGFQSYTGHLVYGCPNLTGVYFKGNAPTVQLETFYENTTESLVTYVQPGTTGWNDGQSGLPDLWPQTGAYRRPILYVPPEIVTEVLPRGVVGHAYRVVLQAAGGTSPYIWTYGGGQYEEKEGTGQFREVGSAMGWSGDDNCWTVPLPFEFPFYGVGYQTAYVCSNGTISFGTPFNSYSKSVDTLKNKVLIAVFWDDLTTENGDIYVESSSEAVTIRWKGMTYSFGRMVNFSATLKKTGEIVLDYSGNEQGGLIGISAGNGKDYLVSSRNKPESAGSAWSVAFENLGLPEGVSLSEDGVLSGTPVSVGESAFDLVVRGGTQGGSSKRHFVLEIGPAAVAADPDSTFWQKYPDILAAAGGNVEEAKMRPSPGKDGQGKFKTNGEPVLVWEDFVAGTDPKSDEQLRVVIEMVGGDPVVTWMPALNGKGVKTGVRTYTVLGAKQLEGTWTPVATGKESEYNFFKVRVEMP